MSVCPACGRENPGGFRFCGACGAPLAVDTGTGVRKTVTVLFCDVTGSTALGETVDPEALRALLAQYFERMSEIVGRHGGTVEKFIGDAVMAVFGVPVAHEDDGLRAMRAAVEMRGAVAELGVQVRIGVNTGIVVAGTGERLVTGDAVNVAARLQQAAQPGEVLVGRATLSLGQCAVEAEEIDPLEVKGKRERVSAFRLISVHEAPERRHVGPFVGRKPELAVVGESWHRVQFEQRCELVTVVGDAGLGKTRLVAEALAGIDAAVVRGRCLPYGEGITYWPVVEIVKQVNQEPSDASAAATIRSLLGETETGTSAEEIAWAFRILLEEAARKRPTVAVFDDIQWGEETFLDLIEHVALLSTGAPILMLCTARPELIDRRPAWPVAVRLQPLAESEVDELIPQPVAAPLRRKIVQTAGGNPLFVSEMVAVADEAGGEVFVPPTLQALLAARLDQLDGDERRVLERGAVEGEIFHRGALQALGPEEHHVTARLAALVRRGLVRPERPQIAGEDGFRFCHLLIRDAAYEALPKATRAELHQRLAVWLAERGSELVELDEIVGYHLGQASQSVTDLGRPDADLATQAAERLALAGRRALWRDDRRAAARLLERTLELTRPHRLDVALELDLASALWPDAPRAAAMVDAAGDRARAANDNAGEALARATAAFHRSWFTPDPDIDGLETLARRALPLVEQAQDHAGLVHLWQALGFGVANFRGRWDDWAWAAEQACRHARSAGQRDAHPFRFALDLALASGSCPADEALSRLDALLPDHPHPGVLLVRAWLLAMLAEFEEAVAIVQRARNRERDMTGENWIDWIPAQIATLAGDHAAAVRYLRPFCELLNERDQRFYLSSVAPELCRELCAIGEYDEAERWARLGHELGVPQNALGAALLRQVDALLSTHRREHEHAEALAREAVEVIERTDGLSYQGDALSDLAAVLSAAGKDDEASKALVEALERYQRKNNVAMANQTRARLRGTPV